MKYLLSLDQGTSSCRAIVFDATGRLKAMAQRELRQIYPRPGWVEHDPEEIWRAQLATAQEALARARLTAHRIAAIGIANQRETTLLWNRRTGVPLHNAIVWQDRRTEPLCARLRGDTALAQHIRDRTGLVIDPYFSATKIAWLLEHVDGARDAARRGELAFGTMDSWLLWKLTGGHVHATDITNASRTMLLDIHRREWDPGLLDALGIPAAVLPRVLPSSGQFGETDARHLGASIPVAGMAGDQQSALFGQACFRPGLAKNTYGTGCFLLAHTGAQARMSQNGLLSTCTAGPHHQPGYAMEGSVFVGGAVVQWLRDGLRAIDASGEVQSLAQSVPDAGGVMFVPAFTGLGAPYWQADARGAILGLSRGSTVAHIARAALESIAFQSAALLQAMGRDATIGGGTAVEELRVDGGASVNDFLMQFQADLLGIPVVRPETVETTALGAAYLAGLGVGVFPDQAAIEATWRAGRQFHPSLPRDRAQELMAAWEGAVRKTVAA